MTFYAAAVTLILVMDPLGNVPVFLAALRKVDPARHTIIILRESAIAFVILATFLFAGPYVMQGLHITAPALGIAGGIILFLIAIRMIFPNQEKPSAEKIVGEPFIVPFAVPLIAGPSSLAVVLLFAMHQPHHLLRWLSAITVASIVSAIVLLSSGFLRKVLGEKGLVGVERLMGMILTTVAVQLLLSGLDSYFHLRT